MRLRFSVAIGLASVAIIVVLLGWLQEVPDLSARDAVTAAEHAFADAGIDATVEPNPLPTTYASHTRDPVDVWAVQATVREAPVELRLARSGAHPVSIDDRTLDGAAYVLSDLEYEAVASHIDDPSLARTVWRNISLTLAAVLVVALALAHAVTAARSKEPTDDPSA